MAISSIFYPKNPKKYKGDCSKIVARSRWELNVMKYFDETKAILEWGSEEIAISYLNPNDGKYHTYIPDFYVLYVNSDGEILKEIIEVKPAHEAYEEYAIYERSKEILKINQAKWKYAESYCSKNNIKFRVITEKELFIQSKIEKCLVDISDFKKCYNKKPFLVDNEKIKNILQVLDKNESVKKWSYHSKKIEGVRTDLYIEYFFDDKINVEICVITPSNLTETSLRKHKQKIETTKNLCCEFGYGFRELKTK